VRDGEIFIILRRAYETLSNPTTRFAFDRFGPDVLTWGLEGTRPDSRTGGKKDVGIREWMIAGLMRSVGFYIFSGGIMALLAGESITPFHHRSSPSTDSLVVGKAREGASYRILLLLLLLTAELTLVLAPTSPPYASSLIDILPGLPAPLHATLRPVLGPLQAAISLPFSSFIASPQFLQVRTLHRLFTTLSIGISQLAGVWTTREPTAEEALVQATMMAKRLEMDCM
jgi:curved DNA-binding protein CbpA